MQFDATTINMLKEGTMQTIYMVFMSSLISYLIGIPLGIALMVTDNDGIRPVPLFNKVLGLAINLLRSVPFLILMIMVIPFTRLVVGKIIGPNAAVVPLIIAAAPYIGRMVESSLKEVDAGVVEAAQSMGCLLYTSRAWRPRPSSCSRSASCATFPFLPLSTSLTARPEIPMSCWTRSRTCWAFAPVP